MLAKHRSEDGNSLDGTSAKKVATTDSRETRLRQQQRGGSNSIKMTMGSRRSPKTKQRKGNPIISGASLGIGGSTEKEHLTMTEDPRRSPETKRQKGTPITLGASLEIGGSMGTELPVEETSVGGAGLSDADAGIICNKRRRVSTESATTEATEATASTASSTEASAAVAVVSPAPKMAKRRSAALPPVTGGAGGVVAKVSKYDAESGKYKVVNWVTRPSSSTSTKRPMTFVWSHTLPRGGKVRIFLDLLHQQTLSDVSDELRQRSDCFRSYKIQGGYEPRVHFLLHEEAIDDDDGSCKQKQQHTQPGYGYTYAATKMKARPLRQFPQTRELSQRMERLCGVEDWNIGLDVVLYRDGSDHIGFHSDNNQGEDTIMSLLVESPRVPRRVVIKTASKIPQDGDQKIELFLYAGDAYLMDGKLQVNYVHAVLKDQKQLGEDMSRLAIVFRHGDKAFLFRDNGQSVPNLSPRDSVTNYNFGRVYGLEEACLYFKSEIVQMFAHRSLQRGVSGNIEQGCDAIVMGGDPNDERLDEFATFFYTADRSLGAGGISKSAQLGNPIRVFRGSSLLGEFQASAKGKGKKSYRYDGLYKVISIWYLGEDSKWRREVPPHNSKIEPHHWYHFEMARVAKGADLLLNELNPEEFLAKSKATGTMRNDFVAGSNVNLPAVHDPPSPFKQTPTGST